MLKENRRVLQSLALVGAFMAWNAASDQLHRHFQLDTWPVLSLPRLSLIWLGTAVTCGGIVWLGCVRHGRGSFEALGWTLQGRPGRMLLLGVLQTACFSLVAFAAAASLFGRAGIPWLGNAVVNMPASERLFYFVMGSQVAFAEESLFRGFVLPAFSSRWGVLAGVLASSVLFAVYHRITSPPFLLIKFLFGAISAVSALLCRSLVPTAIAHAGMWTIFGDN